MTDLSKPNEPKFMPSDKSEKPKSKVLTSIALVVGMLILLFSVVLTFFIFQDKADQVIATRKRAITAEARQKREEEAADRIQKFSDSTVLNARNERKFYRQLECSNISYINQFIFVLSDIIKSNPSLTPAQVKALNAFYVPRPLPFECENKTTTP